MKRPVIPLLALAVLLALALLNLPAEARRPIRADFFSRYPGASGTQLSDLPSKSTHCGV
jgi:hypothetical protein